MTQWQEGDPRYTVAPRAEIIILVRSPTGDIGWHPYSATVETDHGYYIHIHHDHPGTKLDYDNVFPSNLRAVDEWNPDWRWAYAPEVS